MSDTQRPVKKGPPSSDEVVIDLRERPLEKRDPRAMPPPRRRRSSTPSPTASEEQLAFLTPWLDA